MSDMRDMVQHLMERRGKLLQGGGAAEVKRQHRRGKLTARERVDRFFDLGTFEELELWAKARMTGFREVDGRDFSYDGVITGYGEVNGRTIYLCAQGFTVMRAQWVSSTRRSAELRA